VKENTMSRTLLVLVLAAGSFWVGCKEPPEGDNNSIATEHVPWTKPELVKDSPEDARRRERAMQDLTSLKAAMLRYRKDIGELPPRGDYCPACIVEDDGNERIVILTGDEPRAHMTRVESALRHNDGESWKGPYYDTVIPQDPWGMEYTYDDNDPKGANAGFTHIWSAGPDRIYGNADDVTVLVLSRHAGPEQP